MPNDIVRKPLTRLERREIQRTLRFTDTEDAMLQDGAVAERVEFSTYVRSCVFTGHSLKHGQRLIQQAGG
jgi:hypothetical protein